MSSLLSLGFVYHGTHQSFLARVKEDGNNTAYHITIMNDELEKLLAGNNVINSTNGHLAVDASHTVSEQELLRSQISLAIKKYLNEKSLTSY